MYAIVESGGKQYRVSPGEVVKVEKLALTEGDRFEFDNVLLLNDEQGVGLQVGAPYLERGRVSATVLAHGRGEKLRIIRFKRRKHECRRMGHRQGYTALRIEEVRNGA